VSGVIFGLRVDPKFASGAENFKFVAIEKLRLVSNWDENVTYSKVEKVTKKKKEEAYKADIDFTGVQIAVTNEISIYKGEESSKFRLLTAGKNDKTPEGTDIADVDTSEIINKQVHLLREEKKRAGSNTSGTTADDAGTSNGEVAPWMK